jgi:hypothetical protein
MVTSHLFDFRFDEAIEQYHRALSLQPSLSFCNDMLSQVLEDMRLYSSQTPVSLTSSLQLPPQQFMESLLHPSLRSQPDNLNQIPSSLISPHTPSHSFENSFYIHSDYERDRGDLGSEPSFGIGLEYSGIFPSHTHPNDDHREREEREREIEGQYEGEDEDAFSFSGSVESYSRIAGRLSLDSSTMSG